MYTFRTSRKINQTKEIGHNTRRAKSIQISNGLKHTNYRRVAPSGEEVRSQEGVNVLFLF